MTDEPVSPHPVSGQPGPPPAGQPPAGRPPASLQLQVSDAFGYGWRKFMEAPGLWLLVALAAVVTGGIVSWLSQATDNAGGGLVFSLLQFVITNVVGYTLLVMALQAVNGRPISLPDYRNEINPIATYLVGTFLYGLGVALSLVLLIVPGIMFAVAYYFYGLIIADTGADPITALKDARQLSRGHRWPLFGAGLLATLITILGVIAFGIGLLLAIPVNSIAAAHIYRQLRGQPIAA